MDFHLKVNVADVASIYPQAMAELFEDILSEIIDIKHAAKDMARIYDDTHKFWVADSAQKSVITSRARLYLNLMI